MAVSEDYVKWLDLPERLQVILESGLAGKCYVCGSHARGEAGPDSDLDVCFFLTDWKDRKKLTRLMLDYQGRGLDFGMVFFGTFYWQDHAEETWKIPVAGDEQTGPRVRFYEFALRYMLSAAEVAYVE